MRLLQRTRKKTLIQLVEHLIQVKLLPRRAQRRWPRSPAPHLFNPRSCLMRFGISVVRLAKCPPPAPSVNLLQQQRGRPFQHFQRRTPQQIRKSYDHLFIATPNRQHQARIRIKFHSKRRWRSRATNSCEHPLAQRRSTRHRRDLSFHLSDVISRTRSALQRALWSYRACLSLNSSSAPAAVPHSFSLSPHRSTHPAFLQSHRLSSLYKHRSLSPLSGSSSKLPDTPSFSSQSSPRPPAHSVSSQYPVASGLSRHPRSQYKHSSNSSASARDYFVPDVPVHIQISSAGHPRRT